MAIPKPDAAEVAALAARIGYRLGDDAERYARMMGDMLGAYDALEQVPDDSLPLSRAPAPGSGRAPRTILTTRGTCARRSRGRRRARSPVGESPSRTASWWPACR